MKRFKKLTLILLGALFLLTLGLAACAGKNTPAYIVKTEYNIWYGSVTLSKPSSGSKYAQGEEVRVTVTPNEHYEVASVTINDVAASLENGVCSFRVAGDTVVAVEFTDEQMNFSVDYDPTQGSVAWETPESGVYRYGDVVALTVTAAEGYIVSSVEANGVAVAARGGVYSVTLEADTVVVVRFAVVYTIRTEYDETLGSVTVSEPVGAFGYRHGEEVTVTVEAIVHYEVASVLVNDAPVTLTAQGKYSFEVEENTLIKVNFVGEAVSFAVDYDATLGSVAWATPAGGTYRYGETVELLPSPKTGYHVSSVKANGVAVEGTAAGKYSIALAGNTSVTVQFAENMSASLLATLQGAVRFEGTNDYVETIDDWYVKFKLITLFDTHHNAIWLYEGLEDGTPTFNAIYVNVGGKAHLATHDEEGKYVTYASNEKFSDYANPFDLLNVSDCVFVEEGVWTLTAKARLTASTAITGYTDPVTLFRLYEENGAIVRMEIKQARTIGAGTPGEYARYSDYSFEIKDAGTAMLPDECFADYVETAAHAELKAAIEAAAASTSYTVDYHSEEEGYEDLDYHIYVTPEAIYEDAEGWESGYVQRTEDVVPFDYDPETQAFTYYEALGGGLTLADIRAPFTLEVPYAMLESKGEGVFEARLFDTFVQSQYTDLAGAIACSFADGVDRIFFFAWAQDFKITVKDGVLYQVEFFYDYRGYISERVTLTYSNFNSTTLPIELEEEPVETASAPVLAMPEAVLVPYTRKA